MFILTASTYDNFEFKEWHLFEDKSLDKEEGLTFVFPSLIAQNRRQAILDLRKLIKDNNFYWMWKQNKKWFLNLNELKNNINELKDIEWLKGIIQVSLEFEKGRHFSDTKFILTKDEVLRSYPKKIFLSHKGIDKPIVRNYKKTLETIGFSPWLDEDDLKAGEELERSLLKGFKDSCAAIFFITPFFKDEDFLRTEINYSISEKRDKKEKFSIITLIFSDKEGKKGIVPELLKQFVCKEPENDLEALVEIIRALPIQVGKSVWKHDLSDRED